MTSTTGGMQSFLSMDSEVGAVLGADAPMPAYASPTVASERRHGEAAALREEAVRHHERRAYGSPLSLSMAWEPQQKGRAGAHASYEVTGTSVSSVPSHSDHTTAGESSHAVHGEPIEERLVRLGND